MTPAARSTCLAKSVFLRYREVLGEDIGEIPPGLYPAPYLIPVAEHLVAGHGESLRSMSEDEWLPLIRSEAIEFMMAVIRNDLKDLNIEHDVFFSESSLHGEGGPVETTLAAMRERGLVYEGRLAPPKGKPPEDWEDKEQTLFRASDFGDDVDRTVIKSDGTYTYFAADVAYFKHKYDRNFKQMIYVLGADHGGYVKRLQAVAKAICGEDAKLSSCACASW